MARTLPKREESLASVDVPDADKGLESSAISSRAAMIPDARETAGLRSADPEDELALQSRAERVLKGHIDLAKWPRVKGWVWDPAVPGERIRLDLVEGSNRLLTTAASVSRPDIAMAGIGDGLYGFEIDLHDGLLSAGRHVLSVRCADTGTEIPGSPVILDVPAQPTAANGAAAFDRTADEPIELPVAREQPSRSRAKAPPDLRHRAATANTSEMAAGDRKPFRAFVDQVSATEISGWVTLYNEPAHRCVVGLREGRRMLSRAVASLFRPDLRAAGIGDGRHAFVLPMPPSLLDSEAIRMSSKAPPGRTEKVANSSAARESLSADRDFVGNAPMNLAGDEDYRAKLASTTDRLNPAILMDDLREQASVLVSHALRPIPENLQGYVEIVSVDPSGLVCIGGWIQQGNLLEFSAAISERGAAILPAAVILSCYQRDDLPDGSVGFVGLLHSHWRPTSSTSEFLIYFGAEGRLHIRANNPLRIVLGLEFGEHLDAVGSRWIAGRRTDALHRALKSGLSGLPISADRLGFSLNLSVDRVIVEPTYGCFVEGWILSPLKQVGSLRLRLGSSTISCDPRSLYWKPRPDLAEPFPESVPLLDAAGFVGVFPGDLAEEECSDPVLNVRFSDGTSVNHPVPASALARLGHSASLEDIDRLYPAIHHEPFFSGWARAVRRQARLLNRSCISVAVEPAEAALVFAVPAERCDAFLLFEELRQCLGAKLVPPGVVFIANRNGNRADILALFGSMARDADWPCSLFLMDDVRYALHALPVIFSETRMQRFVFVAESVLLTESGWRVAQEILSTSEPELTFLDVESIAAFDGDIGDGPSTECFGWSTSAFIWWEKNAPGFFGGIYGDNGLTAAAPALKRRSHSAIRTRQFAWDAIADAINAVAFG